MITKVSGKETSRTVLPMWLASSVSHVNHWIHRMIKKYTKFTPYAMKSVQMHRFVTHLKATHELGYNHRPFEETVRDTYHWFKEAGMLEPGWTKEKNFDRDTVPGR